MGGAGGTRDDTQFIIGLIYVYFAVEALHFASDIVTANRQVVLAAVSKDSAVLRFVRDGGILGDKEIILNIDIDIRGIIREGYSLSGLLPLNQEQCGFCPNFI